MGIRTDILAGGRSDNSYIFESDDLQFAYKKKTSTVQCVSIIKEVINYYVNQNSCVYMCMLDASKAVPHIYVF